jgi:hypothetical protein
VFSRIRPYRPGQPFTEPVAERSYAPARKEPAFSCAHPIRLVPAPRRRFGHDRRVRSEPEWWRGQTPDAVPVWSSDTAVITGVVAELDLQAVPMGTQSLRSLRFERAAASGLDLALDEVHLSAMWSSFEQCRLHQRSKRLHPAGAEPQGSFAHRPSLFKGCTFTGVRLRLRAGFSVGQARFEDCTFERCRFEEHFSFAADYLRCTFVGPIKTAVFYGTDPNTGRRNEVVDNDFTAATLSDNVGWRGGFPVADQLWPDGYVPPIRDAR